MHNILAENNHAWRSQISEESIQYATCPFRDKIIVHGLAKFEMEAVQVWLWYCMGNAECVKYQGFSQGIFKQRLIDCFSQDCNASLDTHHLYYVYSNFKREMKICDYLCLVRNISVRKVFASLELACLR